jgi:hypothetical protein
MLAYTRTLSPQQAAEHSSCLTRSKIQKFHFLFYSLRSAIKNADLKSGIPFIFFTHNYKIFPALNQKTKRQKVQLNPLNQQ